MSRFVRAGTGPAFLALACVGTFGATPAIAGDAPAADTTTPDADAALLAGDHDAILVNGKRVRMEVSSPKATAALLDTPQTITVVSSKVLQQQNLLTLRDALSTLPGITFGAGEGGGGYGDSINLRGFSANNDITIDGVRDSAQYSRTETFNIQQIEVYNGANSVFNGSGSVGGTINIAQKMPTKTDLTTVSAGIGTDDYYRGTIDANHMLTDTVAFRINGVIHRNDIPGREVEDYKRWAIAPSLTIGIGTPTRLTFLYVHQHDNNVPQYGVPYFPADGGKPADIPYDGYYGFKNIDEQKSTLDQGTMIFEHDFTGHVSIRNLTRYERVAQRTIVDPPQGTYALDGLCLSGTITNAAADGSCTVKIAASAPNGAYTVVVPKGYYLASGPRGNVRDTVNDLGYDQLDLRADFKTGIVENTLVAGGALTWEHFALHTGREFRNADGSDPFGTQGLPLILASDPSATIVGPAGHAYGDNVYGGPINYIPGSAATGQRNDYAAYLFDTSKIGRLFEVNFGLRWERNISDARTTAYNLATGRVGQVTSAVSQHAADSLFSYRGGVVFKPLPAVSLYAAYGNSRTPSISTVNGGCTTGTVGTASFVNFCDVQPEKAKNYEVGVKADLLQGKLELTGAVFRNERSNFKVASNDPALGNVALQVPDGRSRVDGIALGATGNITKAWTIFANYSYLRSKVLQGIPNRCVADPTNTADGCNTFYLASPEAGGPLQQTPKHSGSLLTSYTLPFGLQLGYGLTYQGKFAIVTNPSAKLADGGYPSSKAYLLHRMFAAYEVFDGLALQLNVQNFTNKHYYTSIRNNGWAEPGPLRSATLSVNYTF